jgi:hypothetical protein
VSRGGGEYVHNKVKITFLRRQDELTCYLTKRQIENYGLNQNVDAVILKFGCTQISLKVLLLDTDDIEINRLYLSADLESYLYVEDGTLLQIKSDSDSELEIGPLIGVFINQEKVESLLLGKGVTAYTQFHNRCKSLNGLCCFFSIENIDWERRIIKGLIRKNSGWNEHVLPLPRIIYDRNVENNCRLESIELRQRLKDICQILNPMPKLAKWETIKALEKNSKLVPIIPKTIQYKGYKDLEDSLSTYSSIYLKPDALSKGKGIFRVSRGEVGSYKVEYRTAEENHIGTLKDISNIEKLMEQYLAKGNGYIIQQEICKAIFRTNPFDFRALFQKDFEGVWQLSGVSGRIAGKGSIITSPRSGGSVEDLETILREVFNEDFLTQNGLYQEIIYFGREICLTLEEEFGVCVELGLDLAIDEEGKIWVIEVNGKPLKVSIKRLGNPEIVYRCNRRPIEYAVTLAGFVSGDANG